MEKARIRALGTTVQPQKRGRGIGWVKVSLTLICPLIVAFLLGVLAGPPLLKRWNEIGVEQARLAAQPSLQDEVKLHNEAMTMLAFWKQREQRLDRAATRFGWDDKELEKALRLIEAAKSRFESVDGMYKVWGKDPRVTYELIKREIDALFEQLALTFCEEFELVCRRGVPPDEAYLKRLRSDPQALGNPGGFGFWHQARNQLS